MNFTATLLSFLCLTLVAACTRPSLPTVQHGQTIQPEDRSNLQSTVSFNQGNLPCEPKGLIGLPEGKCIGTPNAHPFLKNETCTCLNEDYIPVPTNSGHTCVHLYSVLETLQSINKEVTRVGTIDTNDISMTSAYAESEAFKNTRDVLEDGSYASTQSGLEEQRRILGLLFEYGATPKETADLITVSVLAKDIRKLDLLLRENKDLKRINRTLRYIQYTLEKIARVETSSHCVKLEKPFPRNKVLALYPPIKP